MIQELQAPFRGPEPPPPPVQVQVAPRPGWLTTLCVGMLIGAGLMGGVAAVRMQALKRTRTAEIVLLQRQIELTRELMRTSNELHQTVAALQRQDADAQAADDCDADMAKSPEDTLQDAQDAYLRGDYEEAMEKGCPVCQGYTGLLAQQGWRITGASACHSGDADLANEAYRKGDGATRKFLRSACQHTDLKWAGRRFRQE